MKTYKYIFLVVASILIVFQSCKDPWSEHNEITDIALKGNLLENIKKDPQLSRFVELLEKTGYDKEISSSKTYTVWAPTNSAIESIDENLLKDPDFLKRLVGFHIAHQSHFASKVPLDSTERILTLGLKALKFTRDKVEGVNFLEKDHLTSNGVFHVLSELLIPKNNIWEEYEELSGVGSLQKEFIESLYDQIFNRDSSIQIGVNALGLPIYDSVFTRQNRYLSEIANLTDEKKEFTFFVLSDAAFLGEHLKLSKFFVDTTQALSAFRTRWNSTKDLVVAGSFEADNLPETLYSLRDSVEIDMKSEYITASYPVSNGIIHVVSQFPYKMETKIKPIVIEGERPSEVRDGRGITRRTRIDPQGVIFQDLLIQNHGVNGLWVRYNKQIYAGSYKVYWRVVRDADLALVPAAGATDLVHFPMKVTWGTDPLTAPGTAGLGYHPAPVINNQDGTFSPDYEEQYLGDLVVDLYGDFDFYLVGNTTTGNGTNTLLLDYLKLEPIY